MTFLLQLYASLDKEEAFHRTIYLFVCPNETCNVPNKAGNFRVFRNQIPRRNDYYDYHPVPEDAQVSEAAPKFKLCSVCGCRGPFNCAQCKTVSYCSKGHQKIDWKAGHKEQCGKSGSGSSKGCTVVQLPEFEIVLEQEEKKVKPEKKTSDPEFLQKELEELKKIEAEGKATMQNVPDSELSNYANEEEEDKFFSGFRKRISSEPDQILRYDRLGEPLWITEVNRLSPGDIPKCDECQGDRVFEFQVMPQLLNSLKSDSLDWGVLCVYTCKDSCGTEGKYLREYVHKQDIPSKPLGEDDDDEDE